MNNYLGNAFSLQMINSDSDTTISIKNIQPEEIPAEAMSCIGHADTAAILEGLLGFEIPVNRVNIKLRPGDTLYVAQLSGGRLPEGATTLPEGFTFNFLMVKIVTIRKLAAWLPENVFETEYGFSTYYHCSACGNSVVDAKGFPLCPHCGANMEL